MLHLDFSPLHGMTICLSFRNVISTLMVRSINQIMQKIMTAAEITLKKERKRALAPLQLYNGFNKKAG